ncbi:TIGR02285 family protein [uncultured Aeromonas sp.]|uniref:TIGR02285 family protein n=1 Tax=uncultured Aeromonas sp. TaxID=263763 RepID=UPI00259AEA6B|nr:TIGR02285 family protein [uncultured Aeromonas sp.]
MNKIFVTFILFIMSLEVYSKETIHWVQYDIPPFYIKDGSYSGRGVVDVTDAMIRAELPQYNHVIIWANIARIRHMMEQGQKVVCGNMIKTPEREAYQTFSTFHKKLPTAPHVIIPSSERDTYKKYMVDGSTIDLLSLIKSKDKKGYFIASRSYGSKFDQAIQEQKNKRVSYSLNAPMGNILDLLLKDKSGFSIAYPEEIIYHAESKYGYNSSTDSKLNVASYRGKFAIINIYGQPKEIFTYVAAPKTEWGYKVMADINKALAKLQSNPDYINENYVWRDVVNNDTH